MKNAWVLPTGIVALAAGLRIWDLGAESFWLDEVIMVRVSLGGVDTTIEELTRGRPALYLVTSQLLARLLGTSEAASRLPSALAGTAAVAMLIPLGTRLFGRPVALLAALLMACSEFNIYYSQDHRYYALFVGLTVASMWAFVRLLDAWRLRDAIVYVIITVLLFHSHHFALAVIAAQNLHVLLGGRRWNQRWASWLAIQALVLLGLLPGLVARLAKARSTGRLGAGWLPEAAWDEPLKTLGRFVISIRSLPSPGTVAAGLALVVLAAWLWHLVRGSRPEPWRLALDDLLARPVELRLTGLWLVCPIAIPFVASVLLKPMYADRYAISASPALYLLVALVIWSLRRQVPLLLSLAALLLPAAVALRHYYPEPVKEQWREAAAYVGRADEIGDTIVFLESPQVRDAFYWYYRGPGQPCVLPRELTPTQLDERLQRCLGASGRFWLLLRYSVDPAGTRPLFLEGDPPGFSLVGGVRDFEQVAVRLYARTGG